MSRDVDPQHERELESALRGVPAPRARPEFRAGLHQRFLHAASGAESEAGARGARAHAAPPSAPRPRPRFRFLLGSLAAAAAILFLIVRMTLHQPATWTVLSGTGTVIVDGRSIEVSDPRRLVDALRSAKTIETLESALRIELRDELVLDLDPHTRLENVRFPAVSPYALSAVSGAVHVATTNAFHGGRLTISTPDLELDCVGTVFGVDLFAEGTCVCCLEGEVKVGARSRNAQSAAHEALAGEQSCFVQRASGKLATESLVQDHAEVLRELSSWLKSAAAR